VFWAKGELTMTDNNKIFKEIEKSKKERTGRGPQGEAVIISHRAWAPASINDNSSSTRSESRT
jgi:hypothetical protein